jgi:DNA-binding NtrC family response regulator
MDSTRSLVLDVDGQAVLEIERPRLRFEGGPQDGQEQLLGEGALVLGRGDDVGLLVDDAKVSRRHAVIEPDGLRWRIRDLESKAGTQVDGVEVGSAHLHEGAVLQLGGATLHFEFANLRVPLPPTSPDAGPRDLVGASPPMLRLFSLIERVGPMDLPVLLLGETGTGKESVARALHEARGRGPLEVVDCTLLDGETGRSELFGHVRGAYTGADQDREGAFLRADGGTLFLDEVAELGLESQAMLLRALQEGEVRPLGADDVHRVRVRVLAATHHDLAARVAEGSFRQDLYYRLAAVILEVPPLRARGEDLDRLVEHLLPEGASLAPEARELLRRHAWPGNVRELKQALEGGAAMAGGGTVHVEHLKLRAAPGEAPPTTLLTQEEREKARLQAAKLLGIARSTLYERLKAWGMV